MAQTAACLDGIDDRVSDAIAMNSNEVEQISSRLVDVMDTGTDSRDRLLDRSIVNGLSRVEAFGILLVNKYLMDGAHLSDLLLVPAGEFLE